MAIPKRQFLYFLTDSDNRSYYWNGNIVATTNKPTPLKSTPSGWKDIEISWGTNDTYFSLQRTFTIPLKFVGDGASILRYVMQNGKGYESNINIVILKWSPITGKYETEYKGRVDLSKYSDDPKEGVTLNAIEGGVLDYLTSRGDTAYDILCDQTSPDFSRVEFDGTLLADKYHYTVTDMSDTFNGVGIPINSYGGTVPVAFISNDGDSVGIITGTQSLMGYTTLDNLGESTDYMFQTTDSKVSVSIAGSISYMVDADLAYGFFIISAHKENGNWIQDASHTILPLKAYNKAGKKQGISFYADMDVQKNGKLFLMVLSPILPGIGGLGMKFFESEISLSFNSKAVDSTSVVLSPLTLLKAIVSKMTDGQFTAESNFFTSNDNIVTTCGDALRNTTLSESLQHYYINTSFSDFFKSYNSIYSIGLKIIDNVIWIEPKSDLYGGEQEITNIGDVSKISVSAATDYLCNTVNAGYTAQDYDAKSGKYEFNSEAVFQLPVTTVTKNYDIRSKYRGDAFGIEFIRANLTSSTDSSSTDTTDNEGDKQAFMINTLKDETYKSFTHEASFLDNGYITFLYDEDFTEDYVKKVFLASRKFTVSGSLNNDGSYLMLGTGFAFFTGNKIGVSTSQTFTPETATITVTFDNPLRRIKRADYTSISGVLDNTVYNVEDMTPKRQLLAHGNYLRSLLMQLPNESITLASKDKNSLLITTDENGTVSESSPEVVSTLTDPLFLPYVFEFTTKVPISFANLMKLVPKGLIAFSYNNTLMYGLPIGSMKYHPGDESSQTWKLLCASKTDLSSLFKLSDQGQYISDAMNNSIFISDLNPLHFVKYGYTLPAKYHSANMYKLPFSERIDRFVSQPKYRQKWQNSDTVNLQFVTSGLPLLELQLFGKGGKIVQTWTCSNVPDDAVLDPYTKQQASISLNGIESGNYVLAIAANGSVLAVSECLSIDESWEETVLFEYYNSLNRINGYFASWRPMLRVEGLLMPTQPDSEFSTYEDDANNNQMLWGISTPTKQLYIGNQYGVPDWMASKVNAVLLLDKVAIDGDLYAKQSDSKLEANTIEGYPMSYYSITLSQYGNKQGLEIGDSEIDDSIKTAVFTLDAQAFGNAEGVIDVEINDF